MENIYSRQLDIFNPDFQQSTIHIFGIGTIGSYTAFGLAKLGIKNIHIYDFDSVEEHNITNQMYRKENIGNLKSESLKETIEEYCFLNTCVSHNVKIEESNIREIVQNIRENDIVILAFDNMESRNLIYQNIKDMKVNLIDSRMGRELLRIFSLTNLPTNRKLELYEKSLITQIEDIPCSARSVNYNGMVIGGLISSIVKKILTNDKPHFELDFSLDTYDLIIES